jgi:hypothetical protein
VPIFATALAVGLVVTAFIAEPALAADVLLAATGILGLLIAVAWVPPVVAWPLAVIAQNYSHCSGTRTSRQLARPSIQ